MQMMLVSNRTPGMHTHMYQGLSESANGIKITNIGHIILKILEILAISDRYYMVYLVLGILKSDTIYAMYIPVSAHI